MRDEIERTVEDLAFARKADARELFDGRRTFVNAELTRLYNLGVRAPADGSFTAVALPDTGIRQGLLGWAGVLAMNARANRTSPTARGHFIRERLLCQDVPPPPPNAEGEFDAPAAGAPARITLRQRLEQHRHDPACAACHALIDPIGVALERFDALGAQRDTDAGLPIDDSAVVDGRAIRGPRELAQHLRDEPAATECLARQLQRHATGHADGDGAGPLARAVRDAAQARGGGVLDFAAAVALGDAFRFAADPL
jgi:hypothetical protein